MQLTAAETINVIQEIHGESLYYMSKMLSCKDHKVQVIQLSDYKAGKREPELITCLKILFVYGIAITNIHKKGKISYA